MLCLVTGGAASQKSEYAESLALDMGKTERFYAATMLNDGKEAEERIDKHRIQREGKGFVTIEVPYGLETLKLPARSFNRLVLLEDLANLLSNEQFCIGGSDEDITGRILDGIKNLCLQAETVIIVTDEVFSDTGLYGEETLRYRRLLGKLNRDIARKCDSVTEVVYGIAIPLK